jgi:hypothetical protein
MDFMRNFRGLALFRFRSLSESQEFSRPSGPFSLRMPGIILNRSDKGFVFPDIVSDIQRVIYIVPSTQELDREGTYHLLTDTCNAIAVMYHHKNLTVAVVIYERKPERIPARKPS